MGIKEAIEFLSGVAVEGSRPAVWADLGCGSGLFTNVLAGKLSPGSRICAVDKSSFGASTSMSNGVFVDFRKADFINDDLNFHNLDGILMANSFHYVSGKGAMIHKMKGWLKNNGMFIIVEYDTQRANRWVPYPLSFEALVKLFNEAGYTQISKTGERNSIYRREKMYVCTVKP